jgi:hypothetical protein
VLDLKNRTKKELCRNPLLRHFRQIGSYIFVRSVKSITSLLPTIFGIWLNRSGKTTKINLPSFHQLPQPALLNDGGASSEKKTNFCWGFACFSPLCSLSRNSETWKTTPDAFWNCLRSDVKIQGGVEAGQTPELQALITGYFLFA